MVAHQQLGPPPPLTGEEALQTLLADKAGYAGATAAHLGVYDRDLLARPDGTVPPVALSELLEGPSLAVYHAFLEEQMLSDAELGEKYEKNEVVKPYWDPLLVSDRGAYEGLIGDLFESHIVTFTKHCRDRVAIFFVRKKNGSLRIIVDARGPNRRFKRPPSGGIAAGESFAQLQLEEGEEVLFVSQSDLKDFSITWRSAWR